MPITVLDRLGRTVEAVLMIAAIVSLLVLLFGTTYAVLARSFFNIAATWSIELVEYMMLFLGFLAAAAVDRDDGHVTSGILLRVLPDRFQILIQLIVRVLVTAVLAIFLVYAVNATYGDFIEGTVIYNVLFVEKWLVETPPTIGMAALVLRSLLKTVTIVASSYGSEA